MSDIEIARKANKKNITEIATKLNLKSTDLHPFGHHIAKIELDSGELIAKKNSKFIYKQIKGIDETSGNLLLKSLDA